MTAITAPSPVDDRVRRRAVVASISGNVLEWYDFAV